MGVDPVDASLSGCHTNMIVLCSPPARKLIKPKDPLPPTYGHWIKELTYRVHQEKNHQRFCWEILCYPAAILILFGSTAVAVTSVLSVSLYATL